MSTFIEDTLTITRKEIQVFLKQPVFGVTRSIIFPLVWILFFAYGFGGSLHSVPIAIVNDASGAYSQQIVDNIATGNTFQISFLPYDKALSDFQAEKYFAVIYIPSDFDSKAQSGDATLYVVSDETNPTIYAAVNSAIQSSVQKVSSSITVAQSSPISIDENTFYGREIRYLDFLAPSLIVMTIVFSAMFSGGVSLLMDKDFGTLKLLMLAPISRSSIVFGKILGGVVQSLISALFTLLMLVVLGARFLFSLAFFVTVPIIMVVVSFAFIGLSTLLATRLKSFEQFILLSQIVIMPLFFVSGAIYPTYSMPGWLQTIANVNPMTYAVHGIRTLMVRSSSIAPVVGDVLFLIAFMTITVLLGIASFKRTID